MQVISKPWLSHMTLEEEVNTETLTKLIRTIEANPDRPVTYHGLSCISGWLHWMKTGEEDYQWTNVTAEDLGTSLCDACSLHFDWPRKYKDNPNMDAGEYVLQRLYRCLAANAVVA